MDGWTALEPFLSPSKNTKLNLPGPLSRRNPVIIAFIDQLAFFKKTKKQKPNKHTSVPSFYHSFSQAHQNGVFNRRRDVYTRRSNSLVANGLQPSPVPFRLIWIVFVVKIAMTLSPLLLFFFRPPRWRFLKLFFFSKAQDPKRLCFVHRYAFKTFISVSFQPPCYVTLNCIVLISIQTCLF